MDATLDAARLDGDAAHAWMQAAQQLRLVLGTALDVSEDDDPLAIDPDDPDVAASSLRLSGELLEEIVQAAQG